MRNTTKLSSNDSNKTETYFEKEKREEGMCLHVLSFDLYITARMNELTRRDEERKGNHIFKNRALRMRLSV